MLNSDEVNALACPGGFIYVFKGLIDYMPSDAELAGVLGHEITHVVKKHTVHQIEKQLLTTLAFAIVTKGDLGIAGLATQALAAGYSRTDERGADKGGFNLCVAAGYNPYSVVLTINKLEDLAKEQGNPGYGIFSSHPEPEERLKRVMKQIKALKVHPEITLNEDNTARVHEGDWGFNITQTVGKTARNIALICLPAVYTACVNVIRAISIHIALSSMITAAVPLFTMMTSRSSLFTIRMRMRAASAVPAAMRRPVPSCCASGCRLRIPTIQQCSPRVKIKRNN